MKTIGLIGGMSWESTALYYRLLNEKTRDALGGLHSAPILLWSFDFAAIERLQRAGDWTGAAERLVDAARALEGAGAGCIVICTNTMHRLADPVQRAVGIPLVHIADATAGAVRERGAARPLLLATRFTMEQDFYTGRLRDRHGIDVRVPDRAGREAVHDTIYGELCRGIIRPASKARLLEVCRRGLEAGADSVILGCTEVGLLLGPTDLEVPVFDSTAIHAGAALALALGKD